MNKNKKRRNEMLDIIAEVKAEAERELMLAKAKLEVVDSIERKYSERQTEAVGETLAEDELAVDEPEQTEFNNI